MRYIVIGYFEHDVAFGIAVIEADKMPKEGVTEWGDSWIMEVEADRPKDALGLAEDKAEDELTPLANPGVHPPAKAGNGS